MRRCSIRVHPDHEKHTAPQVQPAMPTSRTHHHTLQLCLALTSMTPTNRRHLYNVHHKPSEYLSLQHLHRHGLPTHHFLVHGSGTQHSNQRWDHPHTDTIRRQSVHEHQQTLHHCYFLACIRGLWLFDGQEITIAPQSVQPAQGAPI